MVQNTTRARRRSGNSSLGAMWEEVMESSRALVCAFGHPCIMGELDIY